MSSIFAYRWIEIDETIIHYLELNPKKMNETLDEDQSHLVNGDIVSRF